MRFCGVLGLAILAAHTAAADGGDAIEWSPARPLTWDDFVGPVPAGTDDKRVAATAASLAWSYEYSIEWSRNACEFSIESIDSQALFHPDSSWVREGHRTRAVLQHEQGHFDVLQLYKERFDAATHEFLGSNGTCRGRNQRSVTRDTKREIEQLLGPVYDAVWQEYRRRQETYDAETRHGTDADTQAEWTRNIATRLQATVRDRGQ